MRLDTEADDLSALGPVICRPITDPGTAPTADTPTCQTPTSGSRAPSAAPSGWRLQINMATGWAGVRGKHAGRGRVGMDDYVSAAPCSGRRRNERRGGRVGVAPRQRSARTEGRRGDVGGTLYGRGGHGHPDRT